MTKPLADLSRLCVHTITTKPWSLADCISGFQKAGIPSITVWRNAFEKIGAAEAGKMLRDSGLRVVSLCRGGFFPASTAQARQAAIDDNKRIIDEAAAIGAPLIVLVCGAVPGLDLEAQRGQIADGIAAILPHAAAAGVRLGIEPLHPMYAGDRSAINTLKQANAIAESLAHASAGVAVDVYHLWWDPDLESEIARAGRNGKLFAFHVCDWRCPTRDLLNDRGLMGEGAIPIRRIRGWVEAAGFHGDIEVEIFSDQYWSEEQAAFVDKIKTAYLNHV